MPDHLPPGHPPLPDRKIGVLLTNLGTPDGTDYFSMRRYLGEFLSDRRVIETPRLLWWPLLNLIILTTRPFRSGRNYAKIWDREKGDSPLRLITRAQAEKLAAALAPDDRLIVDFGMRYGNPAIGSALAALRDKGCDRILLVPLYPQYSATTTATANDKAFEALAGMRWQPAVRTAPAYHDDPAYVAAIAASLEAGLADLDFEPDVVIASYHGMPVAYLEAGDPYHCQCQKTTRLVREILGWPAEKLIVSFQSRFGRGEWLKPYTAETLAGLPERGVRSVAVVCPGFSADCLETLEEIAIGGREIFETAGGEKFAYIGCLNDSPAGMDVIETVVRRELGGWA